jgi:hypothetical protein
MLFFWVVMSCGLVGGYEQCVSPKRVDGKIQLKLILKETGCETVDWIHLAQDRDQWWLL